MGLQILDHLPKQKYARSTVCIGEQCPPNFVVARKFIVLCNVFTPTRKALDFKHAPQ